MVQKKININNQKLLSLDWVQDTFFSMRKIYSNITEGEALQLYCRVTHPLFLVASTETKKKTQRKMDNYKACCVWVLSL